MMEGPRHQHLHQEWQEPLEEPAASKGTRTPMAVWEGTTTPMAADGRHPGQHTAVHADPRGNGKLRLDARGRLRGKGLDNEG